jgi:catechol 2,3-dioxygenase-like lactoylglutathione lyase family enzyme
VLEKVFYTSVLVSDQDRALEFYTNVLGMEKRVENPTPDGPRFLTVGVEGDDFQLVLWPGTPGQAEPAMGRPPGVDYDRDRRLPEDGRGTQRAWRRIRLRRARVPVGLRRAVPGPRRQPVAATRGPLACAGGARISRWRCWTIGLAARQVDPEACEPVVLFLLSRGFLNAFW